MVQAGFSPVNLVTDPVFFLSRFQPDLAAHEAKLMQKIQLLCVMEVSKDWL